MPYTAIFLKGFCEYVIINTSFSLIEIKEVKHGDTEARRKKMKAEG
ncbi:MAG: hypothetical protein QG588_2111 [Candidatus Poribacteria bacterium]|nr:hypothetical protein [Candidatus Poribacteria bacterium]